MEEDQLGLLIEALQFASEKHSGQFRKGSGSVPYINHPISVLQLLYETGCLEYDVLIAAVLHDVMEDSYVSQSELESLFGTEVASLVAEVTDDMSLSREERKRVQKENAEFLSYKAKQIRIAYKICNVRDVTQEELDWDTQTKLRYLEWADSVAEGCRGINPVLDALFEETVSKARRLLTEGIDEDFII